jgi:hypothetical protein
LWSGAAVAIVLVCGVTFAVVRSRYPPPPVTVENPPPPTDPNALAPPPDLADPRKEAIAQHLEGARAQIADRDFAGALRDHLLPALELEADNQDALDLKKQADTALAAAQPTKPVPAVPDTKPIEAETAGIPRKPNEAYADYTVRVARMRSNLADANRALDRQEFANALAKFRAVDLDQKDYQGVGARIVDTIANQRRALEEAINAAQQNDQALKWRDARGWYARAMAIDPESTEAREKNAALLDRTFKEATKLFNEASLVRKLGSRDKAAKLFQQVQDMTLSGDEIRNKADKELEALKR